MNAQVISSIVEQHAEEAAFLWGLRDRAVHAPHYALNDLARLDDRIEAHLDGLRIAGAQGWECCKQGLSWEEAGEVFTAGVLAFESNEKERIETVMSATLDTGKAFRGLISALGWLPEDLAEERTARLLKADESAQRLLGVAGCAVIRRDAGQELVKALNDSDHTVRCRALRAVGELGRRDLMPSLRQRYRSEDDATRFWSCWSGVLVGDRSALRSLSAFVHRDTLFRERAMQLVLRIVDHQNAKDLLKNMAGNDDLHKWVLMGAGIQGDPLYIPSLINKMKEPGLARIAGEAFSMITDVDLAYDDLEGEWPEEFEAGPSESPEEDDVALDPDEDLPWPDPDRVQKWWNENKERFRIGTRFLCGQPITAETCRGVLSRGFQRQRMAASLELALMRAESPLFETRAPGFRQQRWLCARA